MNAEHNSFFARQSISRQSTYRTGRIRFAVALLLAATAASGCGSQETGRSDRTASAAGIEMKQAFESTSSYAPSSSTLANESSTRSVDSAQNIAKAKGIADTASLVTASKDATRKIIYKASLTLVVDELSLAQQKLTRLVKQSDGYIAETNISGATGAPRRGTWTVRVPVAQYESFVSAASALGELQSAQSDSDDVSEEYYDLEARIKNKKVEETRLVQHLLKSTGKLREILLVEKEISRVRGEIEQMQGRVRVLANLTSLTTVTITINEIKNYLPPKPPTFATEIARTFNRSLGNLGALAKQVLLSGVGAIPWLLLLALVGVPMWRFLRRRWNSTITLTSSPGDD